MAEITLNEFLQRATVDAFNDQTLSMKLAQKTTGTLFPASGQSLSISGGDISEIGTSQVRVYVNEQFSATANWGTIDRVELTFENASAGTDTWLIKLRDTANTDNATEIALSAANWTLTVRYLYIEYTEAP